MDVLKCTLIGWECRAHTRLSLLSPELVCAQHAALAGKIEALEAARLPARGLPRIGCPSFARGALRTRLPAIWYMHTMGSTHPFNAVQPVLNSCYTANAPFLSCFDTISYVRGLGQSFLCTKAGVGAIKRQCVSADPGRPRQLNR